jgi:hypothetical protein
VLRTGEARGFAPLLARASLVDRSGRPLFTAISSPDRPGRPFHNRFLSDCFAKLHSFSVKEAVYHASQRKRWWLNCPMPGKKGKMCPLLTARCIEAKRLGFNQIDSPPGHPVNFHRIQSHSFQYDAIQFWAI